MTDNNDSCQSDSNRLFVTSEHENSNCKKSTSDFSIKCDEKESETKKNNVLLSSCDSDNIGSVNYESSCSDGKVNNIICTDTEQNSIDSANNKLDICIHKPSIKKDSCIVSQRKLVNQMISNYYNPQSISLDDNRDVLKKLLPIYNNLIATSLSFVEKVSKVRHNLNPTKSSKIFRVIYESYKTLFFNLHRSISSILNIKHKGYDVLDHTINNVESASNNRIHYAACNNFYETNNSLNDSTLFYSVPGFTILINHSTLSYRIIAKKSNLNCNSKVYKYDFLLAPGALSSCNRVNKKSFMKVLESISNFRGDNNNNILEFINFCHHEAKSIKCIL